MLPDRDSDDLVTWLLRAVVEHAPGGAGVFEAEQLTRRTFGGSRHYIAKRGIGVIPRERRQR